MSDKEFQYEIDPKFNHTIDEKGNSFIALRKIKWGTSEQFKLDLRKYVSTENGEQMRKGVSFITEDGPHELTKVLLENDYGKPKEVANVICEKRKDIFNEISKRVNGKFPEVEDNEPEEELYDTRRLFE